MTSTTTDLQRTVISKKLAHIRAFRNLIIANQQIEKQSYIKLM